ncbi:MAG: glycosyltransferase family 9 protein, partial [Nitrospirales bacterium]|nr:glycosyltransferase family 9 protein [Nitrospirales bacterium]
AWGPLNPRLPPWTDYLCSVARHRGENRIHLSDAFCGLCGVYPPQEIPRITDGNSGLPSGLESVENNSRPNVVGLVLGAGEKERRIPMRVWQRFIQTCVTSLPDLRILLLGGQEEREIGLAIESNLSLSCLRRVINVCGKTSLAQLVSVVNRCGWVVGSDTGPLHLAAFSGSRTIGWYFSRARVHETGPYGSGHYVWQYSDDSRNDGTEGNRHGASSDLPPLWPLKETVQLLGGKNVSSKVGGWSLWESLKDTFGTYYVCEHQKGNVEGDRKKIWEQLHGSVHCPAS